MAPTLPGQRLRLAAAYLMMTLVAAALFALIREQGEKFTSSPVSVSAGSTIKSSPDTLLHVLLAVAVIIVVTRVVGLLFRRIKQPPVIGEVIGGILLGPSLLGSAAPGVAAYLLPPEVAPFLSVIAQLGVILYMFMVGLELDLRALRSTGQITVAISHASIVAPFVLGSALALVLYGRFAGGGVAFTVFALFMGVSMSVTAFPVLARILTDNGVHKTRLGTIALTCAAVDDATAWCLLALVVAIAHGHMSDAAVSFTLTIAFVVAVLTLGPPLVRRWLPRLDSTPGLSRTSLAVVLVAVLASALATEYIGIHAIFGAFLLGAIIPAETRVATEIRRRIEDIVAVLLLPAFFAYTGMRTQIGLIQGADQWATCAAIILVACAGKFGGTVAASRLTGLSWRASSALGVLMNTRGLVELIVLNIGLDLGVITPALFSMLVLMAIVTTFMTSPLLHTFMHQDSWDEVRSGEA